MSLAAAEPEVVMRLVRAVHPGLPDAIETVRRQGRFENVRHVRAWMRGDPHRGLYATFGFGMRGARPDIVHVEEEPDSLAALQAVAARRAFAPRARLLLFTWQNVDRPKSPAVHWVLRRTLAAADGVICGNRGAVRLLGEFGYRRPTPIIPALGLDPAVFHRRQQPPQVRAFTVGFVGRLAPEKGVDTLIDAVAQLGPPVRLLVAGTGPGRSGLETRAREAGVARDTQFVGGLEPDGVAEFLSGLDVLVVPSRSTPVWQEQYGRVIVEAMGCEVPVVGSDSGAIPEVIGNAGVIFPEGDVDALASRLGELRASPERRARLARTGRDYAMETQTISRHARQLVDFYREVLSGTTGARQ